MLRVAHIGVRDVLHAGRVCARFTRRVVPGRRARPDKSINAKVIAEMRASIASQRGALRGGVEFI